jgi:aryl-alcohol dehydrogenase-like predicted oxidoreductase
MPSNASKLALGTVQFGSSYGVANQLGQVTPNEIGKIMELCRSQGISTIDTAINYGESEATLGKFDLSNLNIITKLPQIPTGGMSCANWLRCEVEKSLKRLNITKLHGLLLHKPRQLLGSSGFEIYKGIQALKKDNLVQSIGVSIYDPEDLNLLCDKFYFDLVQAPFNVLDRRMLESGWFTKLNSIGTEIHVRSVFLQGLLLMKKDQRPQKFLRWNALWRQWDQWLDLSGQEPIDACLRFPLSIPEVSKVVVGVDSYHQLQQLIQAASGATFDLPKNIFTNDIRLLNPSLWSKL